MDLDMVQKIIKDNNIHYVRFEQTDIHGIARSKTIPARHFVEKVTHGLGFYIGILGLDPQGGRASGSGYIEEKNNGDAILYPDLDTFRVLPWCANTARVLTDSTWHGKPTLAHPRHVAKQQLERLAEMGYSLLSSCEYQFHLIDKVTKVPMTTDMMARATIRNNVNIDLVYDIMNNLHKVGLDIESMESQYAPGQLELPYKPSFGIMSADNGFTFKTSIKELALQKGFIASFMTSPFMSITECGCPAGTFNGCHFNHSLWDKEKKSPLFYDSTGRYVLSTIGENWLAGILEHAPSATCFFAPTVNCRKRYNDNIHSAWGMDNRTCPMRVKVNGEMRTYFENRLGAAGSNPYLLLAATVASGIDGIQRKLPLTLPPISGESFDPHNIPPNAVKIPKNLGDALDILEKDAILVEALGEDFIKCYLAVKRHEIAVGQVAEDKGDSEWEYKMYLEYI
ncbi:lengsin-like [Saccoglossus kowalevskii]|uniref:Lengsin n=1 Tax=Saccoglossus kowalevskii TaxID=10224 RepID=A0ABM0GJ03_SACKO|nr:PREDICTED: lengsin-like [Saccoglossus kowalevskii]